MELTRPKEDFDIDSYLLGALKEQGPITISGEWKPDPSWETLAAYMDTRPCSFIFHSVKLFGVEWYSEKWIIDKTHIIEVAKGEFEIEGQVPPQKVVAEWWRRLGYRLFRRLA